MYLFIVLNNKINSIKNLTHATGGVMTNIIRLILIILLFTLYACKSKTESLPKEIAEKYLTSFVLNPNGIAYYKDPTDLKSKLGVIPYKAMFGSEKYADYSFKEKGIYAIKIWFEGKEYFIFDTHAVKMDMITFGREDSAGTGTFGVIESENAILYAAPFTEAIKFEKLARFNIVTKVIPGFYEMGQYEQWSQISDLKGNIYYSNAVIQNYPSIELTKQAIQKKALNLEGYVKINVSKPEFLSYPDLKKVKGSKDSLLSPVWDYYESDYSELVGSKRYYKIRASLGEMEGEYEIRRNNKIVTVNKNPFPYEYLFVSEDNIEYIPEEKITEYTIEHTNFKGDKKLLQAIARQNPDSKFNLTNVIVTRLGSPEKGESYFLVQFENTNLLFKRVDGIYEEAYYEYGSTIVPGSVQDIDGDGLSEFLVVRDGRGSVGHSLVGMKNGSYQSLADVDNISSKSNGIIEKVNFIDNEKNESFHKPGFRAYGSFRYNKGNLIPVKIKYKQFFEMSEKDP
ncbi:MAG: hypothetical protein KA146_10580 [Leptospiraceae bacterium]|nr:hypothetical protein [Leptospiraceae bacterium]